MKVSSLAKRSWSPVFNHEDKLFTGYSGGRGAISLNKSHVIHTLTVKVTNIVRGRSAVNLVLEDKDQYRYLMSPKGILVLIERLIEGKVKSEDGWITINVVQVKQGANLAIELVDE